MFGEEEMIKIYDNELNKVVKYIWFKIYIIFRIPHFKFSILFFFLKSQQMR
jgi:hypothetical protein